VPTCPLAGDATVYATGGVDPVIFLHPLTSHPITPPTSGRPERSGIATEL